MLLALLLAGATGTAPTPRVELERQLVRELSRTAPLASLLFKQAADACRSGDHGRAAGLYRRARQIAPFAVVTWWSEAREELSVGRRAQAIVLAREAMAADENPPHQALSQALWAVALSSPSMEGRPSPEELEEAVRLAREAARLAPALVTGEHAVTMSQVAVLRRDREALAEWVSILEAEDEMAPSLFRAVLAHWDGRQEDAARALKRARQLGLSDEVYAGFRAEAEGLQEPWTTRELLLGFGAAWLFAPLALLTAGLVLSRVVLSAAEALPVLRDGSPQGASAVVRRAYSIVLWLACAYYYLSIPVLAAGVVALGGGILYAFFAIGHVPAKLALVVLGLTLITLWAILKSLFVRVKDQEPGRRLDVRSHPKLRAALDEVARRLDTPVVEKVYLTPGTDMAVMERGGLLTQLRGRGESCLILGVGLLEGFKIGPFKAVLAHEYGHLSNRDTAGGRLALAVRRSLLTMGAGLAQGGAAAWYNPVWLFLNGFHRVFLRISHGASRLQEIMADRWAVFAYGSRPFETGLRHVIERAVRFEAQVGATLREVVESGQPLANLYAFRPAAAEDEAGMDRAVQDALRQRPSPYDSHPSPGQRVSWARALNQRGQASGLDDEQEAWTLFTDRDRLEREMTAAIRENVYHAHGVHIAEGGS